MTIQLLFRDEIRSHVLKILSGECVFSRRSMFPTLYILSPWISDVDIEFSDLYIMEKEQRSEEKRWGGDFLFLDYNIQSINLAHALLLFKLHASSEYYQNPSNVNIITLPLDKMNLNPDYLPRVKTLLDFLDEIGCNVLVNPRLHSKPLLANDLALLGSFNLTSSALYNREEIGVSINDLDNLERLESYCLNVISESQLYGYSSLIRYGGLRDKECHPPDYVEGMSEDYYNKLLSQWRPPKVCAERERARRNRITRGYFLDYLIKHAYSEGYGEFLFITGGYDKFIKSYASNLNLFYLMSLRRLISSPEGKRCIKDYFGYKGGESPDSIMEFVNSKFARKKVPNIRLRIKSLKKS